jgi:hypothetical protein
MLLLLDRITKQAKTVMKKIDGKIVDSSIIICL